MSRIVGIDLGTTHSLVALVDSGIPIVIADTDGRRLTPSVVHYPADNQPPVVGIAAKNMRVVRPVDTIFSIKRFMGRRGEEISAAERARPYPARIEPGKPFAVNIGDQSLLPEEISAEILKKLKRDAEAYLGETVSRAVITVPAYFNDAQRSATKRAGERAGFTVERILNEPTAAALAYGLDKLTERSKIAVYDLGGGTFDLSILELSDGVFQVLATHGNTALGGDDIDQRLVEFLGEKVRQARGPDPSDPVVQSRLREAAEAAKIALSSEPAVEINLLFLASAFSFTHRLLREELDLLARPIIDQTRAHCLRALADARLEPANLDQVILVGGQTRMPLVRRSVHQWFQCAEFEATYGGIRVGSEFHRPSGPALNTTQNPDEAVALGAAIQAEILAGGFKHMLLLDVTPLSLGIETFGGLMNVIIPRNTTIPVKAGELFTTAVDGQREVLVRVLQGERERARDNWTLGEFTLEFAPAPRGAARMGVQFEIDANGMLHVLARDVKTGREKVVEMKSAVDVSDEKVQVMVDASLAHAWDDLHARRWIEAQQQAETTLRATEKALRDFGHELGEADTTRITQACACLREEFAGEANRLEHLKTALAELDQATQSLAQLMMDRALAQLTAPG